MRMISMVLVYKVYDTYMTQNKQPSAVGQDVGFALPDGKKLLKATTSWRIGDSDTGYEMPLFSSFNDIHILKIYF